MAQTKIARALWWNGTTAAEIAQQLRLRSPKIVSQKAYRDKWQRNPRKIKRRAVEADEPKPLLPIVPVPDMEHRADEPKLRKRDSKPITTRNVRRSECRWIPGEPLGDAPMCGHPTVGSAYWCAYHQQRAFSGHRYVPEQKRV